MLEKYLIEYCAPTLAALKTASLFCMPAENEMEFETQIRELKIFLDNKGLILMPLKRYENRELIYLYRKSHLQRDLLKPGVAAFLKKRGYEYTQAEYLLNNLKKRLQTLDSFPHEIGVFLGYPLGDVVGFINNDGKNSKLNGYWKVYCNEYETYKYFKKIKKCRDTYIRLWTQGKTLWQLTVAA